MIDRKPTRATRFGGATGAVWLRCCGLVSLLTALSAAPLPAAEPEGPPRESFRAIVERPLFRPDRRPVGTHVEKEVEDEVSFDADDKLALRFVGTLVVDGRATALVELDGQPGLVRLSVGDQFGVWRVVAVSTDRLELSNGGEERRYSLFE